MAVLSTIKKNYYQDSMKLMQLSQRLSNVKGVNRASAIMSTEANLKMLKDAGLFSKLPDAVNANDLIVTVEAETVEIAENAIEMVDSLLTVSQVSTNYELEIDSLDSAYRELPGAKFAVISVPGSYAKIEAAKAIEKGLHTFLFSDNVTIDEEIELKQRAREKGLLMMGPDCGTAVINGVGLGFANVVNKGPIGVIGAAGTGLQEVTSLIHNWGSGISHAIGVGGRDLSERVGGIMTIESIEMLKSDKDTKALLLVSKPSSSTVEKKIIQKVLESGIPASICFLGRNTKKKSLKNVHFSSTLEDAASTAMKLIGVHRDLSNNTIENKLEKNINKLANSLDSNQKYLRGLFSGGTFCYEAQQVLLPVLGRIYSNAPIDIKNKLKDPNVSKGHACVDLGEEKFTVGRPHPMIDATIRSERIVKEASDSRVAVILFDIVLGYVASPDPAGELIPAIKEAKKISKKNGRSIAFVSHVCGTKMDPQNLESQTEKLEKVGVLVLPTNVLASRVAGLIINREKRLRGA
ncbi:acyl-CoA synthetase FdrA [Desulfobacterota bacterium AH_259_B03_O07]|nr:acyl-CoA synthetase FdrA [Desulfobacterota bacterium AH_259_B03_O07]